jgi:predicted DNA-binding transcriptional regulator YafY
MAKQDYFFRYFTIIKKLRRNKVATFEEMQQYLAEESNYEDRPSTFSLRTFQRDLKEIRTLFKVDIQYDFSAKVYHIVEDQQSDLNNRMLESIDTINSLKVVENLGKYMFFEKRKAQGTHHFYGLLHAIKTRIVIRLLHQKFDDDEPKERLVEPLALKESKGRWYLFAKDSGDKRLKTFGLDRVVSYENTVGRFDYPSNLDVNEHFRDCFGVINPEDAKQEEVVLSFFPEQGKYIKSYPLHESQTVLMDNENELRVSLKIFVTRDLLMEILSYGDTVEIISPLKIREEFAAIYRSALNLYKPR